MIHIIGGGIYGCILAHELSKVHNNIILYERNSKLCQESTKYNLWRIHKGYHYPRTTRTILNCLNSYNKFIEYYGKNLCISYKHYYCISSHGSKVSTNQYCKFMDEYNLPYTKTNDIDKLFNENTIDSTFEVEECLYEPDKLHDFFVKELTKNNVIVKTNTNIENVPIHTNDIHILTCYTNNNNIFSDNKLYTYQICEVCYFKISSKFDKISLTIMDGNFISINPYKEGIHAVYSVKQSVIYQEETCVFNIPPKYKDIINKGIIIPPINISNHNKVEDEFKHFFNSHIEYVGSTFTTRMFHVKKEDTDERDIGISENGNIINVISSKVNNSVLLKNILKFF